MSGPVISALPGYRVELSPERVEPSEALPRDVAFQAQGLAPTPAVYVSRQDRLFVRAYNSVAGAEVEVRGRLLLPEGRIFAFAKTVAPPSDRSVYDIDFSFDLPGDVNGAWLLNLLVVRSAGSFRRGQFFVQLSLFQGSGQSGFRHCVLASGYVGHDLVVNWPGTGINSPLEGPGALSFSTGTNPVAGAEIAETVPTGARWRLHGFRATLVTSAVAGNRQVSFGVSVGGSNLLIMAANGTQAASLSYTYHLLQGISAPAVVGDQAYIPWPRALDLSQTWNIFSLTTGLDAGDNWAAPKLYVEEWIEG